MPTALWFTDDPAACELLASDPFALLIGFAIDQQVPVQKAFAGPFVLKERIGTLDPKTLAGLDLTEAFVTKPALHRFPAAMATRVLERGAATLICSLPRNTTGRTYASSNPFASTTSLEARLISSSLKGMFIPRMRADSKSRCVCSSSL